MTPDMDAWLIERSLNSVPHYWNGKYVDDRGFTSNVNEATKFVNAGDAETVLSWLLQGHGRVAQHVWSSDQELSTASS